MSSEGDRSRRIWKLQAIKVFASLESLSLSEIRKIIGYRALNALLDQGFSIHPDDPVAGAQLVKEHLYKKYAGVLSGIRATAQTAPRKA